MKPSVAKKAISFVLLFGLSGVGVSAVQAQPGKLDGVNSVPSTANKNSWSRGPYCWIDYNGDAYAQSNEIRTYHSPQNCSANRGQRVYYVVRNGRGRYEVR